MQCQILFSGKNEKKYIYITKLLSAEYAQREVKVKLMLLFFLLSFFFILVKKKKDHAIHNLKYHNVVSFSVSFYI